MANQAPLVSPVFLPFRGPPLGLSFYYMDIYHIRTHIRSTSSLSSCIFSVKMANSFHFVCYLVILAEGFKVSAHNGANPFQWNIWHLVLFIFFVILSFLILENLVPISYSFILFLILD